MVANFDDKNKKDTKKIKDEGAPLLKAAALTYDKGRSEAPRLSAKGKGHVAEKILEVAAAYDIPIHKDGDLVEILDKLDLDAEIPLEIYAVVAEIFAYIYKTGQKREQKKA